jgi:ABC-type multidrug transport system ATPase subunit
MMKISLQNAGKRFNREWIFRHFNFSFTQGGHYAITGQNGSGKSTLLQVIAGAAMHSEGQVVFEKDGALVTEVYKTLAFAAPYLDLIEEMTAIEFLDFHSSFKKLIDSGSQILKHTGLENAAHRQIRYYSSGMKQRLKLAQAFFTEVPVLLLDEPTTNLDAEGIQLYHSLINTYAANRLIIVSSNDVQEYSFCKEIINIGDYKKT